VNLKNIELILGHNTELTPLRIEFIEKLIVVQLIKKFPEAECSLPCSKRSTSYAASKPEVAPAHTSPHGAFETKTYIHTQKITHSRHVNPEDGGTCTSEKSATLPTTTLHEDPTAESVSK
jgi:hypothetical protein